MRIELIYIYHNCFVIRFDGKKALLFDYPVREMLDTSAYTAVCNAVYDADLYLLFSHSHGDHFSPDLIELPRLARRVRFVVSKDIIKACPELRKAEDCLVASPGRCETIGELTVEALPSNDLGVAFLLQFAGVNLYFGGDLANWNWEDDEEDRRLEAFYRKNLDKLAGRPIRIAFSNADPRLKNWSGAYEFIERIQPELFIPMHAFGKTEMLKKFERNISPGLTRVWIYEKPGDSLDLNL